MSKWIPVAERLPKQNQWIVVTFGAGFKCGQYDGKHPFSPAIVDRREGKFFHGFTEWKPLTPPKK